MINETNSFIVVDEIEEIVIKKTFFLSNIILDNLYIEIQKSMIIPILCGLFCQFDEMIRERAHCTLPLPRQNQIYAKCQTPKCSHGICHVLSGASTPDGECFG